MQKCEEESVENITYSIYKYELVFLKFYLFYINECFACMYVCLAKTRKKKPVLHCTFWQPIQIWM